MTRLKVSGPNSARIPSLLYHNDNKRYSNLHKLYTICVILDSQKFWLSFVPHSTLLLVILQISNKHVFSSGGAIWRCLAHGSTRHTVVIDNDEGILPLAFLPRAESPLHDLIPVEYPLLSFSILHTEVKKMRTLMRLWTNERW